MPVQASGAGQTNRAGAEIIDIKAHYRRKTRLTTDKLPEDLLIEIIEHELPQEKRVYPDCIKQPSIHGIPQNGAP